MAWITRAGERLPSDEENRQLSFLYGTRLGRCLIHLLIRPWVSKAVGKILDGRMSRCLIGRFVRKNKIDLTQYESRTYRSFNDFFTRAIRPELRPVDREPDHLIAPCDGKLSVYSVAEGGGKEAEFFVKGRNYTLTELLRDEALAAKYAGGTLLLFRLTVDDYHRYAYIDDGEISAQTFIPGVFHTVQPIAGERYPIYRENSRAYAVLRSEIFGDVLVMEVGAMLVGRIVNAPGGCRVTRGEEKGRFEFGGSTVIVCLEPGRADLDADLMANTAAGHETVVKLGEKIGAAAEGASAAGAMLAAETVGAHRAGF